MKITRAYGLMLIATMLAFESSASVYYVDTAGADAGPGSFTQPWRTIQKSANAAAAGDTVRVRAGTYAEKVVFSRSGAAGTPIVFLADPGVFLSAATLVAHWQGVFTIDRQHDLAINGFGVRGSAWFGIYCSNSQHVTIAANTTDSTGASGISVWYCTGVTVLDNEVTRACWANLGPDMGTQECITVSGCDSFEIARNQVHNSHGVTLGGEGIDTKENCRHGAVHHNRVWDQQRLGIYVDSWNDTLDDVAIYANTVHDCSDGIAVSSEDSGLVRNLRIFNNVSYRNVTAGIVVTAWAKDGPRENIEIINNTCRGNGDPSPAANWGGGIEIQTIHLKNCVIRNNIASANKAWQIAVRDTALVVCENNLIDGYRGYAWTDEIKGRNPVSGDPKFVDTAQADFHCAAGSAAIDRGMGVGAPAVDFDGVSRPQGAAVDLGAFEYRPSAVRKRASVPMPLSTHARKILLITPRQRTADSGHVMIFNTAGVRLNCTPARSYSGIGVICAVPVRNQPGAGDGFRMEDICKGGGSSP